jgi:cysteinyl-tRNA synthetase
MINKKTIDVLTQRFIDAMDEDSAKLGIIRPDIEPRATQYIQSMLDMISKLIEKGHAYMARMAMCFTACAILPITASSRAKVWMIYVQASGLK